MSPPLVLLSALLASCASGRTAIKTKSRDEGMLATAAQSYWQGVRWNDGAVSAAFIEDVTNRGRFQAWLEDEWEARRVVDVDLVSIEVSDELSGDERGWTRTGTVRVRTEGYSLPAQILGTDDVDQSWYRTKKGWWLDWQPPDEAEPG